MDAYQVNVRTKKIFTATLNSDALKKLYELLKTLNEEALKNELNEYEERVKKENSRISTYEIKKNKAEISKLYAISIEIFDTKGGYLSSFNPEDILNKNKLPDDIKSIQFRNSLSFQNQRIFVQSYQLSVEFDFSKVSFGGINSNASNETFNNSRINVVGFNGSWVEGACRRIEEFILLRKNNRGWIHRRDIFAFIMWLIVLPITFWNLGKIDKLITAKLLSFSGIYITFFYIYVIVIIIFISSLIFRYARWLYPPVELKSDLNNIQKAQRIFLYTILSGLIIKIAIDIISFFTSTIF